MTPTPTSGTISSPLSYTGATRRTTAWIRKAGASSGWMMALAIIGASLWLVLIWSFITCWYVALLLMLPIVVPYRMIRRSQRKSAKVQQSQLEAIQQLKQ